MTITNADPRSSSLLALIENKLAGQKIAAALKGRTLSGFLLQVYDDAASDEVKTDLRGYFSGDPCYANDEVIAQLQAQGYTVNTDSAHSNQESRRYFPRSWVVEAPKQG